MKPFKFTLQALRTLRQRQENEALEAYAAAVVNRVRAAENQATAERVLAAAQAAWHQQAQAGCPAAQMMRHAGYCQELANRRNEKLAALAEAERQVGAALQRMLAARQQREVVERFYDKQRQAYNAAVARAEQKFLDELAQRRPELGRGASFTAREAA